LFFILDDLTLYWLPVPAAQRRNTIRDNRLIIFRIDIETYEKSVKSEPVLDLDMFEQIKPFFLAAQHGEVLDQLTEFQIMAELGQVRDFSNSVIVSELEHDVGVGINALLNLGLPGDTDILIVDFQRDQGFNKRLIGVFLLDRLEQVLKKPSTVNKIDLIL
jgi:hypothetical protein